MIRWMAHRFSRKLAVTLAVSLTLLMVLSGILIHRAVRTQLLDDLWMELQTEARLIQTRLPPKMSIGIPSNAIQKIIEETGLACNCRVTLIDRAGTVLADSEVPYDHLSDLDNHAHRPEFETAIRGAPSHTIRFSATRRMDLFYTAIPLQDGGVTVGALRLAVPLTRVERRLGAVRAAIVQMTFWMILFSMGVAWAVSRSMSRKAREMSALANDLLQGRYETRLRRLGEDELGQLGQTINHLAEKIQETIQDLSRDTTQLKTILDNMVEGVLAVDTQGRIAIANPSLKRVFELDNEDPVGRPLPEVLRHSTLNQLVMDVKNDGTRRVIEVRTFNPPDLVFEAHAVPLKGDQAVHGVLLVLHDITRLRHLEQLRKEFVANVSHELRTPLTSIKGFAETLRMGALDDKARRLEFVKAIETHAEQMARLVDDLLDLAAIESGKRVTVREPVPLSNLIRDCVRALEPVAAKKGVKMVVEEPAGPVSIQGDADQLKQVLINLLDNAVKFNREKGLVTVRITDDSDSTTVAVEDTGVGIPAGDLSRVFERFFRVDKARSRELGGTGLGLAIVKHIIEAHSGRVSVHSTEGQGSVFSFSLPR